MGATVTNQELRLALLERARGRCECGGQSGYECPHPAQELDHFFGRGRAPESAQTCWLLSHECHRAKTDNYPDAATWCRRFMRHANRLALLVSEVEELSRWLVAYDLAAKKLEWHLVRAELGIGKR